MTISLQALSLVEKAEPVQVCFTLHLRDQRSMWMQDGCEVYMAPKGSCFMVTWTIFINRLLEVGLTQNGTPNTHNWWFILFYHTWRHHVNRNSLNSIWLRTWWHMTSLHTWGSVTTHDFGGVLGWSSDTFFQALKISWLRHLAHVWSGPNLLISCTWQSAHDIKEVYGVDMDVWWQRISVACDTVE